MEVSVKTVVILTVVCYCLSLLCRDHTRAHGGGKSPAHNTLYTLQPMLPGTWVYPMCYVQYQYTYVNHFVPNL